MLWNHGWNLVCQLRPACARTRTFLWMSLCLAGMTTRKDLQGVTSMVRSLGLVPACYDRLLDFFHSSALDLDKLTCAWFSQVFTSPAPTSGAQFCDKLMAAGRFPSEPRRPCPMGRP
jgi:hypothetical protein